LAICRGTKHTQAKDIKTAHAYWEHYSTPFRAADHLRTEAEIAVYIEEMLADGDARAVPIALRTVADARVE
jgi:DNA-binding phage protein